MEREKLIALVTAAQQGGEQAATDLYEAFHDDLYYHISKTVNDPVLAEDLLQDTYLEIFQTIGQLQEPAAFVTWSKQIAITAAPPISKSGGRSWRTRTRTATLFLIPSRKTGRNLSPMKRWTKRI